MAPPLRKLALTAHVIASVGWLGSILAFLALAVTGLTSEDAELVRAVYLVAEPLTWFVILPLALASLVTGLVQGLATTWGLFRHYWVVFKLLIAVVATIVLVMYTETVGFFAGVAANAAADVAHLRAPTFVLHAGAALVLLSTATVLAVYKPPGRIKWRRRYSSTRS